VRLKQNICSVSQAQLINERRTLLQIRKTSLVLFGQSNNETRKRSISESYADHPLFKEESEPLSLEDEIQKLRDTIKSRDDEIVNLRREIHKLKVSRALEPTEPPITKQF
jgi:hypothetical protein